MDGRSISSTPGATMALMWWCALCRDSKEPGWLCAEPLHLGRPWGHDGCEAEGRPCICNPQGAVEWRELIAEFVDRRKLQ